MELCSDGHDEVCYEARKCPVCEMRRERDEKQAENIELNKEIDSLTEELNREE